MEQQAFTVNCPDDEEPDAQQEDLNDLITGTVKNSGSGKAAIHSVVLLPQTGQTTSYEDCDDGLLQKGADWPVPRFTDNGNGTVTDNLTGLVWLKDANCFGTRNWVNALLNINILASGSYGLSDGSQARDWRLPNIAELLSLVDISCYNPVLPAPNPFYNIQSIYYWSSSTCASITRNAWIVDMGYGSVESVDKNHDLYVWPVRGGQ